MYLWSIHVRREIERIGLATAPLLNRAKTEGVMIHSVAMLCERLSLRNIGSGAHDFGGEGTRDHGLPP